VMFCNDTSDVISKLMFRRLSWFFGQISCVFHRVCFSGMKSPLSDRNA
jgi:hypothetical protein